MFLILFIFAKYLKMNKAFPGYLGERLNLVHIQMFVVFIEYKHEIKARKSIQNVFTLR